nr:substrate-binding domain-containing protein [Hoeflea prorocentri]
MTGRTALIALVTNAFANPFINRVVDVFTTELQSRNLRPLAFNLKGDFDWKDTINLMLQYQIDGVVIASSTLDQAFIDRVVDAQFPTVQAFGRYYGDRLMDSVFVNNIEGGKSAAAELLARDYKRPGFIGAADSVSTTRDRLSGFQQVLLEADIRPQIIRTDGYSHQFGREAAQKLMADNPDLDSLFCADDLLALGALDALHFDLGKDAGEIGVIGFNDIDAAGWPSHSLSTFRAHTGQVVLNAIDMLETRIVDKERPGEQRIVSCKFIERDSLRPRKN